MARPHLHPTTKWLRPPVLYAIVCCGLVGACGEGPRDAGALWPHSVAQPSIVVAGLATSEAQDTNMRTQLGTQLGSMLAEGQLRGRGIWQRGEVRRKGHAPPVALHDDAEGGVVDGYVYQAYVTPPGPRLASMHDDCLATSPLQACGPIQSHTHVTLERTGGILGASFRTDGLIAYQQEDETHLCACPPSTLTERLPLCCASLCCR